MMSSLPRNLRAVLFDFDGTLVDSAEASFRCYQRTFENFGISFDRERYAETYAPDWLQTYTAVGLPRSSWEAANALWLEHYSCEIAPMIDGVEGALKAFENAGLLQGIVTSGTRHRVIRDLDALGIRELFKVLVCAEDAEKKKPHPQALMLALDSINVSSNHAVYVGDSPEDIRMARDAGVFSIAIPGAYPNREALAAAGADLTVATLPEAVRLLLE